MNRLELWFILGRHVAGIDDINDFLDEFWLGQKLCRIADLLEVDLALNLLAAMALDAVSDKYRLELLLKIIRCPNGGQPCENEEQNAPKDEPLYKHDRQVQRSERTPWLSANESISTPMRLARVSQRFELSVPLFIFINRPCLIWPCAPPATIIGKS